MVGVMKFEALHRQAIANPESGIPHRRTGAVPLIQNNKVVEKNSANLVYNTEQPRHAEALIGDDFQ